MQSDIVVSWIFIITRFLLLSPVDCFPFLLWWTRPLYFVRASIMELPTITTIVIAALIFTIVASQFFRGPSRLEGSFLAHIF